MKIIVADTAGFCSGVKRAIQQVQEDLQNRKQVFCLGEIIHNRRVVEHLRDSGMITADSMSDIPDKSRFVVRTHGLPKEVISQAEERNFHILDLTCPKVKKIHHLVLDLTKKGYFIYIAGNPNHPEVQAVVSLARGNARVLEEPDSVKQAPNDRIAVVVQTTFNPEEFLRIVDEIILQNKETRVFNTLCEETIKRQQEAKRLSGLVDLMVVVGGKNSSNTKTLFNITRKKVRSVHIEGVHEMEEAWFLNTRKVGIISGASTPAEEVRRVYEVISGYSKTSHPNNAADTGT